MIATVTATSPLTVREPGATRAVPAQVVTGSSFTPTVGAHVLVIVEAHTLYIVGGVT